MTGTYQRPAFRLVSTPTPEAVPFWTGGECGELLIIRCRACLRFFHPPAPVCWRCRSTDVAPEPVSGRGTVAAYTVNWHPWIPGFDPPYVVAMVELDEERDVRLTTNVVGVPVEQVEIGMVVEVFFERWTPMDGQPGEDDENSVWVPLFRPVAPVSEAAS